jgi:2-hydroxychromene-2-carboxylate isomerase
MSLRRRLSPWITRTLTHPGRRRLARRMGELRRALRGGRRRVEYFHQVDDPYCQLVAPLLEPLMDRYAIELVPVLVGPPPDEAAPARDQLVAFSRKDAADIAAYYDQVFDDIGEQPASELVGLANAILAANIAADRFAALVAAIGEALWAGDGKALATLAEEYGASDPDTAARAVEAGNQRRRKLGHYLAATFHYSGEWYWGIERLSYLEERLVELGLGDDSPPVVRRTAGEQRPVRTDGSELTLEFFASLRSPYTAISFERVRQLVDRYGIRLVLRPVLPMVMRGLPVPPAKSRYILLDTKREAERAGIAFGHMADPIGRPVELGYSLFAWASEQGRALEWLHEFARGASAEGIDMGSETGLRRAAERAGLSWDEARTRLGNEDWRDEIEANRLAMTKLGLWGVPSFRLHGPSGTPDFVTWGQDRLWLIEERILERIAGA